MGRGLLVFDLDETLLHSIPRQALSYDQISDMLVCIHHRDMKQPASFGRTQSIYAVQNRFAEPINMDSKINVRTIEFITILRPYAIQLLAGIYKENKYDMAIFSMGSPDYVDLCVQILQEGVRKFLNEPKIEIFKQVCNKQDEHRISDEYSCKDLSIFKKYKIEDILLIDNKCVNYYNQPLNGFPVYNYDHRYILRRECGLNLKSIEPSALEFSADLTLYRLSLFIKRLRPEKTLQEQNLFILVT